MMDYIAVALKMRGQHPAGDTGQLGGFALKMNLPRMITSKATGVQNRPDGVKSAQGAITVRSAGNPGNDPVVDPVRNAASWS